ncbi:MAG: restriction endonuclease [Thermoplasmatota archaeon]
MVGDPPTSQPRRFSRRAKAVMVIMPLLGAGFFIENADQPTGLDPGEVVLLSGLYILFWFGIPAFIFLRGPTEARPGSTDQNPSDAKLVLDHASEKAKRVSSEADVRGQQLWPNAPSPAVAIELGVPGLPARPVGGEPQSYEENLRRREAAYQEKLGQEPTREPGDEPAPEEAVPNPRLLELAASENYELVKGFVRQHRHDLDQLAADARLVRTPGVRGHPTLASLLSDLKTTTKGLWVNTSGRVPGQIVSRPLKVAADLNYRLDQLGEILRLKGHELTQAELGEAIADELKAQDAQRLARRLGATAASSVSDLVDAFVREYRVQATTQLWRLQDVFTELGLEKDPAELACMAEQAVHRETLAAVESRLRTATAPQPTFTSVDGMDGYQFQQYLTTLFGEMGYRVERTPLSGDQGADLILHGLGETVVIQAKRWTGPVGNDAVQEAVAAVAHYHADRAMVVATTSFTKSAHALAASNRVELVDGEALRRLAKRAGSA